MTQTSSQPSYFKKSTILLLGYFNDPQNKWQARALFAGTLLTVLTIAGLGFLLGWWCFPLMYSAFIAKNVTLLLLGVGSTLLMTGTMAGLNYLAYYLKNKLYVGWRSWLTKRMVDQYLNNKTNYLEISRIYKDVDNPDQRIQEDIDKVVDSSLDLSLGFIDNLCNLTTFGVLLAMTGGSVSFVVLGVNLIIPGFFVWLALAVGITTSLLGYAINRSLSKATKEETIAQSNLRSDLRQIKTSSEEIAIEHAEAYYQSRIHNKVDVLTQKSAQRLATQNGTTSFNLFNANVQTIIPLLAAAPLYFNDLLALDAFYSIVFYFSMITRSLNWFINSFEMINKFQTSLDRIVSLHDILDKDYEHSCDSTNKIVRLISPNPNLVVKNLNLNLHGSKNVVIKGLNLQFAPGVHTLIQAHSGTGKSSLFKAIAGTWLAGEGEIILPNSAKSLYFLPQNPTIADDTLRNVLVYPDAKCRYSDEELTGALTAVSLQSLTHSLDKKIDYKSLGEQQRIAFARVLLRKPDWVFLDEATASLDEPTESQVYSCLKELLPKTTIISIGHRSTVKRYHDNVLFFTLNDKKEVQVQESKTSSATLEMTAGIAANFM